MYAQFANFIGRTILVLILGTSSVVTAAEEPVAPAPPTLVEAITKGTPSIWLRWRFEAIDDDRFPQNGNASTVRLALGYRTLEWKNFSAFAEMEHVSQAFLDDYREGPFDLAKIGRGIVADPPGTELNQAYLRYTGIDNVTITAGRQALTFRKAPFHRYSGTVLWRQNFQTHDAIRIDAKPFAKAKFSYAHSFRAYRIFGDDAPSPFDIFECDGCHMINFKYDFGPFAKLEAFSYILDFDNAAANSTETYGVRLNGAHPLTENVKLIYAGEFAAQSDHANNPLDYDANYYLGEVGFNYKIGHPLLKNIILKFDYEVLEGDGTGSFRTPLSTLHAFQGWADRFLATPRDGIEDMYGTLIANALGGKFIAVYHDFSAQDRDYDYGSEWNFQYTRPIVKYVSMGIKAAFYDADQNATALARAGSPQNFDSSVFWAWMQFKY